MSWDVPLGLSDESRNSAPLLKWPGGKRALLKHILPLFPQSFGTYYEPFIGGGAVFFRLQPNGAVLSDKNCELINCYVSVRDRPAEVISYLADMPNTNEDYFRIRRMEPSDSVERAARLIYLTTLSFNGIHRVNLKGKFNVPYGGKTHLRPSDPDKINAASTALSQAVLLCADFEESLSQASEGDLVYLDPPYTVAHSNNGFVKYNDKIFSWQDQIRLARVAETLAQKGCHVFVSNADHPTIRALYHGFKRQIIKRASVMAASSEFRREITECVFFSSPKSRKKCSSSKQSIRELV
jgi:DNA adenine methylase